MMMVTAYNNGYYTHDDNLETFGLLWLDVAVNTNEENRRAQQQLRSIINHITTFEDPNLCQEYIQSVCLQDRLILIVSGRFGRELVPRIHHVRQLSSIYVYCKDKQKNQKWAKKFRKIKAVTDELDELISRIKVDQKKRVKVEDPIVINIFMASDNPDRSTIELNSNFMHSLLLIDVLLQMNPIKTNKQELVELCKKEYEGNKTQLDILREFDENYSAENALWWYTRDSFLYKMLNKALQVQNIDLLFLFRFFIRDIHQELERNKYQSPICVYRAQVLSNGELNNLRKSIGAFIFINSFFSATTIRHQALEFLKTTDISSDLCRVLFEIYADPHVIKTKPFADISSYGEFVNKSEILLMIGSIFRLGNIHRNNDQIWVIRLTLCGDNKHGLRTLAEYMKEAYGDGEVTLLNFGQILRRMGKLDLAEKFYRRLLSELLPDDALLSCLYYSLGLVLRDKKDFDSSLQYLDKSLQIKLKISPHDYRSLCDCSNVIGTVHRKEGHYDIALSWYKKGIELLEQDKDPDHLRMAHFYNNTAIVYEKQKKFEEALDFNKKALIIREQYLPPNHPDIGLSHNNIGNVHYLLRQYDLALEHFNRSLNIKLKSLPPDHPNVAQNYRNIGLVYEDEGELNQALKYFQKAATIYHKSLSSHHPDVVKIEEDIKRVSSKLT